MQTYSGSSLAVFLTGVPSAYFSVDPPTVTGFSRSGTDPASVTLSNLFATITYNFETRDGPVPEPASWAMMLAGFGAIGAAMRRRQVAVRFASRNSAA